MNWKPWADTIEGLKSLLRLDDPAFQIIVCDTASTDGSVDRPVAWAQGEKSGTGPTPHKVTHLTTPGFPKPVDLRVIDADTCPTPERQAASIIWG